MASDLHNFHVADYIVFGGMLLISITIGIYYACAGGKQKSTKEFFMANQSMRSLPVALSVLASFFSASTLLGTPAEIYQYGTQYWISVFGAVCAPITGALLFGPLFFKLKVVSVFQYLEERFESKTVRLFGAVIFLVKTTMGMGIVLYGPSTALSAVTPFPEWAVILVVGGVCTFYTTIGGLKAVIWTDVFQTLVMLAGMMAVIIKGCIDVGGLNELWDIAEKGNRIEFFRFDVDPHVRHTFWALIIGIYFVWLPPYTVDQQMVQRFSSARSLKEAKWALLLNVPGMFILITLCSFTGLVMYAYYVNCDPIKTHEAGNPNQLLPLFVVQLFRNVPGVPGLFVACLLSGAMSSISSMLNSLSAVTWEDFLKLKFSKVTDERATVVTKCLVILFGCIGVGMAFAVRQMGGTVLQASLTLNGAAGAPLVGLFILGACFTSSNWIGALVGGIIGFAFPMWCGIGKYVNDPQNFKLSTSTEGCNVTDFNQTLIDITNSTHIDSIELEGLQKLYGLSYIWFSSLGILTVVIVGLLTSCVTGPTKHVDDRLQLHFWENFCIFMFPPIPAIQREKQQKQLLEKMKNNPTLDFSEMKKLPSMVTFENGISKGQMNSDNMQSTSGESNTDPLEKETSCSENKDKENLTIKHDTSSTDTKETEISDDNEITSAGDKEAKISHVEEMTSSENAQVVQDSSATGSGTTLKENDDIDCLINNKNSPDYETSPETNNENMTANNGLASVSLDDVSDTGNSNPQNTNNDVTVKSYDATSSVPDNVNVSDLDNNDPIQRVASEHDNETHAMDNL